MNLLYGRADRVIRVTGEKGSVYFLNNVPQEYRDYSVALKTRSNDCVVVLQTLYDYGVRDDDCGDSVFKDLINIQGFNREDTYLFCNDKRSVELGHKKATLPDSNYVLINKNAFISEMSWMVIKENKKFDYIINSEYQTIKRLDLARRLENVFTLKKVCDYPGVYGNEEGRYSVNRPEIVYALSRSKVGMALSYYESNCHASGEYLMCGLPVVSTECLGGRDAWYTDYNSIVCDATEEDVERAGKEMLQRVNNGDIDPYRVRNECIEVNKSYLVTFFVTMGEIFEKIGLKDPDKRIRKQLSEIDHFGRSVLLQNWGCRDEYNIRG